MKSTAGRGGRLLFLIVLAVLSVAAVWWAWERAQASSRRLVVRHVPHVDGPSFRGPAPAASDTTPSFHGAAPAAAHDTPPPPLRGEAASTESRSTLRLLVWNIAHGRGDVTEGWKNNWRGGSREERALRLIRMATFIREVDADVVVLNEVDFDANWSHRLNYAEVLARATGYGHWVEQRNYDFGLPLRSWAFGNALLSRVPIQEADWVEIPAHSSLEALALGAKSGSVVHLGFPGAALAVVPVHVEVRSRETRLGILAPLDSIRAALDEPLLLAGDFNSTPSGWSGAASGGTLLDSLLARGFTSPRALGPPEASQLTFPTPALRDARDWVLAEEPLRILETRVLHEAGNLSDHAPILAVLELPSPSQRD